MQVAKLYIPPDYAGVGAVWAVENGLVPCSDLALHDWIHYSFSLSTKKEGIVLAIEEMIATEICLSLDDFFDACMDFKLKTDFFSVEDVIAAHDAFSACLGAVCR